MLYMFLVYLIFCQQMLDWSFRHHRPLTTLLGVKKKKFINKEKIEHYVAPNSK
jgi:hypothetical protein